MAESRMGRWGELNGFVGLVLDNLAVLLLVVVLCTAGSGFYLSFVVAHMIPGTVAGVLVAGLVAMVLAYRTGRKDATAIPMGLDTPTAVAIALLVLLPTLRGQMEGGRDKTLASFHAWHVGAACVLMLGLVKLVLAPFGGWLRSVLPRPALLGALTGLALPLLVFLPMVREIGASPLVGLPVLALVLLAFLGPRKEQLARVPSALLLVVVGLLLYAGAVLLGQFLNVPLARTVEPGIAPNIPGALPWLPKEAQEWGWWEAVFKDALLCLPMLLPFALNTIIGAVECVESAEAEGDKYGTGWVLAAEAVGTVVGGALGGVVQTTPYYGHPAYKTLLAGKWYPVLSGLFLVLLSTAGQIVGLFTEGPPAVANLAFNFFTYVPPVVLLPVVVLIGVQTVARSVEAIPARYYPVVALTAVPPMAYMLLVLFDLAVAGRQPAGAVDLVLTLRCLASGFVLTSLLWAALLVALLDGRVVRGGVFLFVLAGLSALGIVHTPSPRNTLAWPPTVYAELQTQTQSRPRPEPAEPAEPAELVRLLGELRTNLTQDPPAENAREERTRLLAEVNGHIAPLVPVAELANSPAARQTREALVQTPYHWALAYLLAAVLLLVAAPALVGTEEKKTETPAEGERGA